MTMHFSWRLRMAQWYEEESFSRTRAMMERHPQLRQETMLFYHDGTMPNLPDIETSDRRLAQRMRQLRDAGFEAVGIDTSAFGIAADLFSIRGSDVERDGSELTVMVAQHGGTGRVPRPCPSDPGFADFQRRRLARLAATTPDFIYLEDELRLAHHQGYCCFCRHCLSRFQDGRWSDRESLVAALDQGTDDALRAEWVGFVEQRLIELVRYAREGVDQVDAAIDLGLMPVNADHSTYNGAWLGRALAVARSRRVRPGHGWYQDTDTRGMLRKVTGVGRLNAQVDLAQTEAQYEYETWPCGRLDKSDQAARHEVVGALMAGCACFTVNEGPWKGFVDEVMEQRMADWERWLPAWRALAARALPLPQRGFYVPATPDLMAHMPPGPQGWFTSGQQADAAHFRAEQWLAHGWAQTPVEAQAHAVLLPRECAAAASDAELERWTRGALICDAEAARIIAERGFAERVGARVLPYEPGTQEVFIADAITDSDDVGQIRWHLAAESNPLQAAADGVETFGEIRSEDGRLLGASLARYANPAGGRIVVIGYDAWEHLVAMPAHWRRLRRLVEWLAVEVPIILDRCRRLAPAVRIAADGRACALVLTNTGFDATGPLRVRLHARPTRVLQLAPDGQETEVRIQAQGEAVELELPDGVAPWNHVLLIGS